MKRLDPVLHLLAHGCELLREGGRHSVFVHSGTRTSTAVPRHYGVNDFLIRKICGDLDVPTR